MERTTILASLALGLACSAIACDKPTGETATTSASASAAPAVSVIPGKVEGKTTTAASASAAASAEPAKVGPAPAFHLAGFQTPESVLYDDAGDRYLVSNINGSPGAVDNNGYISVVSPDGKLTTEKWIEGGKNKVTLNAPKGSAISNGTLYVADIDTLRAFDAKTGAPKTDVKITGATFLNDVSAAPDGKIYVSDTGIKFGDKGPEPTGTDGIWVIEKGKATELAKGKELNGPNGVLAADKGVWVVAFGAAELYRIDEKGQKVDVTKTPKGQLDGLVKLGDDVYLSSWESSTVYKGKPSAEFTAAISPVKAPADIGVDSKRKRILVPLFMDNAVEAYDMK